MKLKKRNKKSKIIIISLIVSLLFISIGYSYIKTTLSVRGNVSFASEIKTKRYVNILGQEMIAYMDNANSPYVTSASGINFSATPSDTNGKGLYLFSSTSSDENPIYYFRGGDAVDGIEPTLNNNVLFGGFCWKIVRTTEKGGIKLIYNGVPNNSNVQGKCANVGDASHISEKVPFNTNNGALADVGYMYGTRYSYTSWDDTAYVYGSDVNYNTSTKVYTLTNISASNTIANVKTKHYTCKLTTNGTCGTVYYAYSLYNGKVYAIELKNGEKLENIINNSFTNTTNSAVKTSIDNWFKNNLNGYINKLEDAVWCNDRSISGGGYLIDGDITSASDGTSTFGMDNSVRALHSNTAKPELRDSITCQNKNDRFTVSDTSIGNGKLTYPVGLLTGDEITIGGHHYLRVNKNSYMDSGNDYWTMSPSYAGYNGVGQGMTRMLSIDSRLSQAPVANLGVNTRPSIVLKKGTVATSGDGSLANPYVVS